MTDEKNNSNDWQDRIKEIKKIMENASKISKVIDVDQLKETQKIIDNASKTVETINVDQLKETQRIIKNANMVSDIVSLNRIKETQKIMENANKISTAINLNQLKETQKIVDNAMNIPEINNFDRIGKAANSIIDSIPNFVELFSDIDLENIVFTEDDEKIAEKIVLSDNIETSVSEELRKDDEKEAQPTNSILLIIIVFFYVSLGINQLNIFSENSTNQAIFNINIELNDDNVPSQKETADLDIKEIIKKHFDKLLYAKEALDLIGYIYKKIKIYLRKSTSSQVVGKLDAPLVVKIVETDEEWSYIIHEDPSGKRKLEGWVLTRNIKKLNKRGE